MNSQIQKKELIVAAYSAPQGSRIQVFRNKKGEITWSAPMFGSSYNPNPENIRKKHTLRIITILAILFIVTYILTANIITMILSMTFSIIAWWMYLDKEPTYDYNWKNE